jgi:hypothetical protein
VPLELDALTSGPQQCPGCYRAFQAVRFRPLVRQARVTEVVASGPEEAASCAAHRRNAAVGSCARCGIFMCELCRTEADGRSICTPCFERLADEGTLHSAETRYRDYLGLSWLCGLVGLLCWLPGVVTGPFAVYFAFRALGQMRQWGDVGGRGRVVVGMALGVISTLQGGVVVAAMVGA